MEQRLEIVTLDGGALGVVGEVDSATAPLLAAAVHDAGARIVLDLGQCRFMDSTGIAVLIEARVQAQELDGELVLVQPSEAVMRLLEICGLVEAFRIDLDLGDRDDATGDPLGPAASVS